MEKAKIALALQTLGGVNNYTTTPHVRGEINILLVGDAGENKTGFLESVTKVHPKSVHVTGTSVSVAGLQGTAVRDELTGLFIYSPGAIPRANNGLLAADEIDKMKAEDREIFHECMEQGCITYNKANIHRRMETHCAFLVAMNPKDTFFTTNEAPFFQIGLTHTLINRFDIVLIIKKDRSKGEKTKQRQTEKMYLILSRSKNPKLSKQVDENHKFISKYVSYARKIVPATSDEILRYVAEKYSSLEQEHGPTHEETDIKVPITARQGHSLMRLAEAYAKLHLRNKVLKEDVDFAYTFLISCLAEVCSDETGQVDIEYMIDGVPKAAKNKVVAWYEAWGEVKVGNLVETEKLTQALVGKGFKEYEVEEIIAKRLRNGEIMEPRRGFLQQVI